jgi:hypothetical protein
VTHLRGLLPAGWTATLCAVDGATTGSLARQLPRVPPDTAHLVVAIGGNDALQHTDVLTARVRSAGEALTRFARPLESFERSYRAAIGDVAALGGALAVCTVYNGALEPDRAEMARIGLTLFNDVILRVAFDRGIDVIELRAICTEPGDYANPIEPSGPGGLKIARAIAHATGARPPAARPARVWAG